MSAATCPEPTPAERARSVLAAAGSLTVTTQGHRIELIGLHTVDAAARLLLHNPPDGHLAAELAVAPHGDLAALVEFTDVAAVAVRERVRSRLTLAAGSARSARRPWCSIRPGPCSPRTTALPSSAWTS
ncbi:hypothetical protein AB0C70_29195 [Streptomyces sp. NPDC048564]|uniref:hypothetical protein n=1 Tax=Streptomyces sp. NPDC048564 TaxID=3155760 RepID=UPI00342F2571